MKIPRLRHQRLPCLSDRPLTNSRTCSYGLFGTSQGLSDTPESPTNSGWGPHPWGDPNNSSPVAGALHLSPSARSLSPSLFTHGHG